MLMKNYIWMVQEEVNLYRGTKKLWVDLKLFYSRSDARFWKKEIYGYNGGQGNTRIKKISL